MNDMMDAAGVPASKRKLAKITRISGPTPAPQAPSGHVQHVLVRVGKDGSEEIHVYGPAPAAPVVTSAGGVNSAGNFGQAGGGLGS